MQCEPKIAQFLRTSVFWTLDQTFSVFLTLNQRRKLRVISCIFRKTSPKSNIIQSIITSCTMANKKKTKKKLFRKSCFGLLWSDIFCFLVLDCWLFYSFYEKVQSKSNTISNHCVRLHCDSKMTRFTRISLFWTL